MTVEPRTEAGRAMWRSMTGGEAMLDGPFQASARLLGTNILAIESEARAAALREVAEKVRTADEAASVAHDYIWPQSKATTPIQEEASDAIWTVHEALRAILTEATGASE